MPIVVSLPKSGTNLISRCMDALGYRPTGAGIRSSYPGILSRAAGEESGRTPIQPHTEDVLADSAALIRICMDPLDPRSCLFLHSLEYRGSLVDSCLGHVVPVLFNYRDPRAVLVSLAHYLTQGAREGFTRLSGFTELSIVISRLSTTEKRLAFLMKYAPNYLGDAFRRNAWLLKDPNVLAIPYEALVGEKGGGSDADQLSAIGSVAAHLGVATAPSSVAGSLYETTSRTFRKGTIDGWKEEFTPEVEGEFGRLYSDILDAYGYR